MMKSGTAIFLIALLAACNDGQPFEFDVVEDDADTPDPVDVEDEIELSGFTDNGTSSAIPLDLANNLTQVVYTPGSDTITVSGAPLDTTPIPGTLTRNASLDIPGYAAYSVQEDNLDRMFIALVSQSADGSVEGGVILDGGQFNRFFGGAFYRQNDGFSAPDTTLVSYTGDYAGLTNLSAPRASSTDILPLPAGVSTNDTIAPQEPDRVTGTVFINADFADNQVNGGIIDRQLVGRGTALDDLALTDAAIAEDGSFVGSVELSGDTSSIGAWGGTFGGADATGVAGTISIENYIETIENEAEYGAFVLSQCGQPGEGTLCGTVNP